MKPIDLSALIKGLMLIIGVALAIGRLDNLKKWAAHEAFGVPHSHAQGMSKQCK